VTAEPVGFPEFTNFVGFPKFANFAELAKLMEKRSNSQKSSNFRKKEDKRAFLPLSQPPTHKLSMTFMVWNISIGQLGLSAWLGSCLAPAHHWLNTGDWKKVLDFLLTTKNISVINILLMVNPKYSTYWEEN